MHDVKLAGNELELIAYVMVDGELKRIEDMTREELIVAIKLIGREARAAMEATMRSNRFYAGLLEARARRVNGSGS